jgi:hypothetical protein
MVQKGKTARKSANLLTRYHREAVANLLSFSKTKIQCRIPETVNIF